MQPIAVSYNNPAEQYVAENRTDSVYHDNEQAGRDDSKTNKGLSQNKLGTWSFLLAMGGLICLGVMIVFLASSILGVCVAGGMMLILGLGALGTGYAGVGGAHHAHHNDTQTDTHIHKKSNH